MKLKPPPLNALRTFDAAAQAGTFKGAAELLNVTQSAVSHQIKFLEDCLGVVLFVRSARGLALSPAGREFHRHIRAAFAEIDQGLRNLQRLTRPDELTIQTYSTIAVRWLMPRINAFQKLHPRLVIRLVTSQNDPDLADENCDVALLIGTPPAGRTHATYLFTPRLFPVCTAQIAATLHTVSDLAGQTILQVYPSPDDWPRWLAGCGQQAIDPDSGMRFDSYDHALRMAARGHGIALSMQPYAGEELAAGVLMRPFPAHDLKPDFCWYIVSPETRAQAPHVRAFRKWVIEQVESDPELAPLREPHA
jgi:DNA-binding transcriptional LysR family regulator